MGMVTTRRARRRGFAASGRSSTGSVFGRDRRYLMGHSPGKAAILAYTHLDQLRRHYSAAIRQEWPELITAINERVETLRVSFR